MGEPLGSRAKERLGRAVDTVEKLTAKKPDPYEAAVAEYNRVHTALSDAGVSLLSQRERTTDLIEFVELLVNSIAHTPKAFHRQFDEIDVHKEHFRQAETFARADLELARRSAASAGAGFVSGAAVSCSRRVTATPCSSSAPTSPRSLLYSEFSSPPW